MPIITPCWLCTAKNLPTMPTNSRSTVIGMKSPFHSPALPPPPQRPQVLPLPLKLTTLPSHKSAKSATKAHSKPPPATLSAPVSLPKKPTNHAMSLTTQRPLPLLRNKQLPLPPHPFPPISLRHLHQRNLPMFTWQILTPPTCPLRQCFRLKM